MVSAAPRSSARAKAQPRRMGRRQGCQRLGSVGSARKKDAAREPGRPAEADRASWNARSSGPLAVGASPGSRAKRKLRRDAGKRRGAGARSRSCGKQKSVGTHRGRASRRVARQAVEGRPSPKQTVETADAGDGGSPLNQAGCDGRSGRARKRSHAPYTTPGETGARSETVRRHYAESSQRRHGVWLCRMPQGVRSRRLERRAGWAQARGVAGTTEGALGRSSIFSSGRSSCAWPRRGDGGTILAPAVKPTLCAREACRAAAGGRTKEPTSGAAERQRASEVGSSRWRLFQRRHEKRACGGSASRAPRGVAAQTAEARFQVGASWPGDRMHRDRVSQSERKRIAALPVPGPSSANCTGPRTVPTPYDAAR